ncbi:P49 [Plodia interpunctella granulovirus]|uniref:p49 n=1 Tax=Plodia interpunctella granulovirus TaxID=262175 RepID=A0A1L5JH13_9BBAC|nr:P49 [Plodia interpunctella granulovirus]APO13898.1 P49 [Plodia interpunctella granulovirus]
MFVFFSFFLVCARVDKYRIYNMSVELLPLAFIHLYFEIDPQHLIEDVISFIHDEKNYKLILNYLSEIQLRHMIGDSTEDTFKYVMPQFKFVCDRDYQLEIVKFDFGGVYLKKGAVVYATNLFVPNPAEAMQYLITLPFLQNKHNDYVNVGEKFFVWNGMEGVMFARPYLDWMAMKVCNGTAYTNNDYYRLYILGEEISKAIIDAKISPLQMGILKNFHKGTPLKRTTNDMHVLNYKTVSTTNYDKVFDMFQEEFDTKAKYIHFIQRDYIFDAKFPIDLLKELQMHWVSDTSVYKVIQRFDNESNILPDLQQEVVVDRYGVDKYRKMVVDGGKFVLPVNRSSTVEHLFVPRDVIQIRHTLNAAFVPGLGLVILATHMFFGARRVLNFEPNRDLHTFIKSKIAITEDDVFYHVGGSFFLEETRFVTNQVPIYILVRVDDDLIVRHNLIRSSRKLQDLKYDWVYNTILSLFVRKY